jgi:hypothetical protein
MAVPAGIAEIRQILATGFTAAQFENAMIIRVGLHRGTTS